MYAGEYIPSGETYTVPLWLEISNPDNCVTQSEMWNYVDAALEWYPELDDDELIPSHYIPDHIPLENGKIPNSYMNIYIQDTEPDTSTPTGTIWIDTSVSSIKYAEDVAF
jgi:hypothetical protein